MNLVTIIIPMYNESMNVENCIKNLCEQSNQNFNVVFVDDGSIDETLQKLKMILNTKIKFNYKIISQENKGAASARKKGIESAKTKYVMMLDCDDRLSVNAIEEVYFKYKANINVDIIIPTMVIQREDGQWNELTIYTDALRLDPIECVKNSLDGWGIHGCFTIKKEIFLKSYKDYSRLNPQDENFINNDEVLTRLNFINSNIIMKSKSIYYYCFNPASTTKKISQNRYLMIKNALILNSFLVNNYNILRFPVLSELISVIWDINMYKYKFNAYIDDKSAWDLTIKEALKQISFSENFFKLKFKKKAQLFILKLIYGVKK